MQTDNILVSIETTDGRTIRSYSHDGRTYVESPEDRTYQIRVKNKTNHRVKAVISVDSLNIVSGKPATNDPAETGYILGAHEEQLFKGYRVDNDTVAQFKFVKREKSYATEVGSGAGNGVIAVRAYAEKEKPKDQMADIIKMWQDAEANKPKKEYVYIDRPYPVYPWRPYWERPYWGGDHHWNTTCGGTVGNVAFGAGSIMNATNNSMGLSCTTTQNVARGVFASCSLEGSSVKSQTIEEPQSFDMGSGWGDALKDVVKEVTFEVGVLLAEIAIYYASLDSLKTMGVNVDKIKAVAFPEPFARTYCAKPSGWSK